jgi:hypothetical protein
MIGWGAEHTETIDLALRSIRNAALGKAALYLNGPGDLIPLAGSLHRHIWDDQRPFVVCDPYRADVKASARNRANKPAWLNAVAAARLGSLCMRATRPPLDLAAMLRELERPQAQILLMIVDADPDLRHPSDVLANPTIWVPALAERARELPAVIDEYLADAGRALSLSHTLVTDEDRRWLLDHAASLPEIEKSTLRVLALRGSRSFAMAARRLHMAPVSLIRWCRRRTLPASLAAKLQAADD